MQFLVEAVQHMGLLITNGEFNSHLSGVSTEVVVEKEARGNVRFVNSGFWGPVKHNVVLHGEGFTSFSDCYSRTITDVRRGHSGGRWQGSSSKQHLRGGRKQLAPGHAEPDAEGRFSLPAFICRQAYRAPLSAATMAITA